MDEPNLDAQPTATRKPAYPDPSGTRTNTGAVPETVGAVPPAATAPDDSEVVENLGPYRVLGVLGRGGMGVVYQAEDTALRRVVALKVMRAGLATNPAARARFLREGRAQAAVEHDHVAVIHHVGEHDGVPFLVMPLLKGMTLADALKANPTPPLAHVARIGREMAEGLGAAHARGLIHRDVKPANVWLEGDRLRVKVLDFGLARAAGDSEATIPDAGAGDESLTRTGGVQVANPV